MKFLNLIFLLVIIALSNVTMAAKKLELTNASISNDIGREFAKNY